MWREIASACRPAGDGPGPRDCNILCSLSDWLPPHRKHHPWCHSIINPIGFIPIYYTQAYYLERRVSNSLHFFTQCSSECHKGTNTVAMNWIKFNSLLSRLLLWILEHRLYSNILTSILLGIHGQCTGLCSMPVWYWNWATDINIILIFPCDWSIVIFSVT